MKAAVTANIQDERSQPTVLAERVMSRLIWGDGHVLAGATTYGKNLLPLVRQEVAHRAATRPAVQEPVGQAV